LEPEFSSGQTQADGQTTNRHEEANSRFFLQFYESAWKSVCWFCAGKLFQFAVGIAQNT